MKRETMKTGKVTLDDGSEWQGSYAVDWSGASDRQRDNWAASNRWIVYQRGLRKLSLDEVEALCDDNGVLRFNALTAGQKVMSEQERIDKMIGLGIPKALAEIAVRNPEMVEKLLGESEGENE